MSHFIKDSITCIKKGEKKIIIKYRVVLHSLSKNERLIYKPSFFNKFSSIHIVYLLFKRNILIYDFILKMYVVMKYVHRVQVGISKYINLDL